MPKGIRTLDPAAHKAAQDAKGFSILAAWVDHKTDCLGRDGRSPCTCNLMTTLAVVNEVTYLADIADWVAHRDGCFIEQPDGHCTCGLHEFYPTMGAQA